MDCDVEVLADGSICSAVGAWIGLITLPKQCYSIDPGVTPLLVKPRKATLFFVKTYAMSNFTGVMAGKMLPQ